MPNVIIGSIKHMNSGAGDSSGMKIKSHFIIILFERVRLEYENAQLLQFLNLLYLLLEPIIAPS